MKTLGYLNCMISVAIVGITCGMQDARGWTNSHLSNISLSLLQLIDKNQESTLHYFQDTDQPMTIYGYSVKPCYMLSMTMTIQQPYIIDFVYHRELSHYTRTCKASGSFFVVDLRKMTIQRNVSLVWGSIRLAPLK